jgi:hypothetical protein
VALAWSLTACGQQAPTPDYQPVPDPSLYARVAKLPGVTDVDIKFRDTADAPKTYVGEIRVERGTDPVERLDQAIAILRQGRYQAAIDIVLYPPGRPGVESTSIAGYTRASLDQRYGPQPGDGKPPDTAPTPPPQ